MATAALGPALPFLAANTSSVIGEVSILFTAKAGGYLLGSIVGGRLYDRLPGHLIAGAALLGIAATTALTPTISLLGLLTFVLLVLGILEGALDVGCNAMLVWIHGWEVGPYMNALHFFFGIGTFIAPIIIAQSVLRSGEITWGFWILALLIAPLALWLPRVSSPAAPVIGDEKSDRANILLLSLIMAFLFFYVGAEVGFGGWVFTYALQRNLANATTGAYLTSAFYGAFTVGRLLSIPIAARLRPRWILISDLGGGVLSVGLILLFPDSAAVLWTGAIFLGLSMASVFPSMFTLAERRMTLTGVVTSWFFVGASAGAMCLPWVVGQLFEPVGPQIVLIAILGSLLMALAVFVVVIRVGKH